MFKKLREWLIEILAKKKPDLAPIPENTYYVDTEDGHDDSDGLIAPLATVAKAVSLCRDGDRIVMIGIPYLSDRNRQCSNLIRL